MLIVQKDAKSCCEGVDFHHLSDAVFFLIHWFYPCFDRVTCYIHRVDSLNLILSSSYNLSLLLPFSSLSSLAYLTRPSNSISAFLCVHTRHVIFQYAFQILGLSNLYPNSRFYTSQSFKTLRWTVPEFILCDKYILLLARSYDDHFQKYFQHVHSFVFIAHWNGYHIHLTPQILAFQRLLLLHLLIKIQFLSSDP